MYRPGSPEAEFGETAKRKVVAVLKTEGYLVVCLDELGRGRAAVWEGNGTNLPAMDICAIKDGRTVLLDSKGKHQSTYTYSLAREDHGIDAKNYDWYRDQCRRAGVPPRIAIYEVSREISRGKLMPSNCVLIYNLAEVSGMRRLTEIEAPYGKGGMVYWARVSFEACHSLMQSSADIDICLAAAQ
jgi:hypothetical protein